MADRPPRDPLDRWEEDLRSSVISPLADAHVVETARAAAGAAAALTAASGVTTAATAAVATHAASKFVAATLLATALAGGAAAATGSLPDPIQSWIAGVADHVGINLPRPELEVPDVDVTVTVPTLPNIGTPPTTLPGVTVPGIPPPGVDLTIPTVPGLGG